LPQDPPLLSTSSTVDAGATLFGDRRYKAPMIALVNVPDGIAEDGVRRQLLDEHGIEIMAAFGPLRGKVWRIGLMGYNAQLENALRVLAALESVLASRGYRVAAGSGVEAARAHARAERSPDLDRPGLPADAAENTDRDLRPR
jgi:(S)-ureidoglycine-glyoxylate aminotransferase